MFFGGKVIYVQLLYFKFFLACTPIARKSSLVTLTQVLNTNWSFAHRMFDIEFFLHLLVLINDDKWELCDILIRTYLEIASTSEATIIPLCSTLEYYQLIEG